MSHILSHNNRNLNIDILRIVAIYAIILIHSSSSFLFYNAFNNGAHWWIISVTYSSFLKWSAGVFVMISGAYMLEEKRSENIGVFLKKRFLRIIIPFIIWAILYKIIEDPQAFIQSKGLIFKTYIADLYNGRVEYHLWFIYMIGILYLLTPVLSFLVNHAPKNILYYFIGLWLLLNFFPDYLHQFKDWEFGSKYYLEFSRYSGLYILGFLLKDVRVKKPWILLIVFIFISLINSYGTYYLSSTRGYNDYFFLSRLNITNIINSILIFLFFVSIKIRDKGKFIERRNQWIIQLSLLSYGIFLNHVLILNFIRSGKYGFLICSHHFLGIEINPSYGVLFVFIIVAVCSTLFAYLISKIPIVNKLLN